MLPSSYSSPATGLISADLGKYKTANRFSLVERSHFESRNGTNNSLFAERGIRFTAIGSSAVWYVTPWKMAESFGRMASLNRNYHLNVVKHQPRPYVQFEQLTQEYRDARGAQMRGMSGVLTSGGTAAKAVSTLQIRTSDEGGSNRIGNFYVYAKTGTIGEKHDRHRLGVIISDHDLATTSTDDLDKVKFVVIYFTFSDTSGNVKDGTYAHIIDAVMKSASFRHYMSNN